MKNIKPRGVKKGETPQWKVGRKATGLKRNKNIRQEKTPNLGAFSITIRTSVLNFGNNRNRICLSYYSSL